MLVVSGKSGIIYQDTRILQFYETYCDPDGQLKLEYEEMILKTKDETTDDGSKVVSIYEKNTSIEHHDHVKFSVANPLNICQS